MRNLKEHSIVKKIKNERYQIIYTQSDFTQWKTVGVFSLNETLADVTNLQQVSYILGSMTIVLAVITALFFTRSIVQPIGKLRKLMRRAEAGDFDIQFKSGNQDEIGQLGRSFNNMIIEIRKLIDQVYEEQQKKREAELKILQAQIKPHFLYNTLDTIQWMAKERKADDVAVMIIALTNLFRIGLSKGKETISVSEEIEHIKSYLFIQKARYENKLKYEIVVDPEVMHEIVIKLTLQPLVENAIYHGIKERRGEGYIKIEVRKIDDKLCLSVMDNGAGIPADKLIKLQSVLSGTNVNKAEEDLPGFGLFNVHERIRLAYGERYGVQIYSVLGEGTKVEVWYPIRKGEGNHVESDHR
jgi:two-component system sensor histidine kinase YesM